MNKKFAAFLVVATLAGLVAGCVETVDGTSHAGVPWLRDSVEDRYERPVAQVLDAAKAVIKFNGQLVSDNTVNNSLQGRVNQRDIWIRVDELDPVKPVSRIIVQVRGGDDVDLAHELAKQIALHLAGH